MSLAAAGQLIDRYAALFLPRPSGHDRAWVGGVHRQGVANLLPAANQVVETGRKTLDLRFKAFRHWRRRSGKGGATARWYPSPEQNAKNSLQRGKESLLDSLWVQC